MQTPALQLAARQHRYPRTWPGRQAPRQYVDICGPEHNQCTNNRAGPIGPSPRFKASVPCFGLGNWLAFAYAALPIVSATRFSARAGVREPGTRSYLKRLVQLNSAIRAGITSNHGPRSRVSGKWLDQLAAHAQTLCAVVLVTPIILECNKECYCRALSNGANCFSYRFHDWTESL